MNKFCFIILLLWGCSCTTKTNIPDNPMKHFVVSEYITPSRAVDLEKYDILSPFDVIKYKDWIVFQENVTNNMITFVSSDFQKHLSCLRQGQGPLEVFQYISTDIIDGQLFVFNSNLRKILKLDILDNDSIDIQLVSSNNKITSCFWNLNRNRFINTSNVMDKFYYKLEDTSENVISSIPYPEDEALPPDDFISLNRLYFNTIFTVSPDKTKYAWGASRIAKYGFGRIIDDSLTLDKLLSYSSVKTLGRDNLGHGFSVLIFDNSNLMNSIASFSTDKYACFLYSGYAWDCLGKLGSCILVYDWDGTPVKKIDFDENLFTVRFDPKNTLLYGISMNPEATYVEYNLKGIIE